VRRNSTRSFRLCRRNNERLTRGAANHAFAAQRWQETARTIPRLSTRASSGWADASSLEQKPEMQEVRKNPTPSDNKYIAFYEYKRRSKPHGLSARAQTWSAA